MQVIGEEQKEYELGYRLSRKYWGKGFATEAAIACRDCGLNTFGLRRLISIIEAANHQSIRVAEKVGMTFEKKSTFHGIAVEIYALEKGHDRSERRESRGWGPAVAPSWTLETARDATK